MMKSFSFFLILSLLFSHFLNAQNIDSLKNILTQTDNDSEKVEIYILLGQSLEDKNINEANLYYNKALQLAKQTNDSLLYAKALFNFAIGQDIVENFSIAKKYYFEASRIFLKFKDTTNYAYAIKNIGGIYFLEGVHDSAMIYELEALYFFKAGKQDDYITSTYIILGSICANLKLFDEANYYYKKALDYVILHRDTSYIAILYNNFGNIFLKQRELDSAEIYLNKSMNLFLKQKLNTYLADVSLNLGELYILKGNRTKASFYLNNAKARYSNSGNNSGLFDVFVLLAKLYKDKPQNSYKILKNAEKLLPFASKTSKLDFFELFSEISFKLNKNKEAYEYLKIKDSLEQDFFAPKKIQKIIRSETQFKTASQEILIEELEKVNRLNKSLLEKEKQKRKAYTIIFYLFIILLLGFAFLLWILRKNRKLFKKLEKQNEKLARTTNKLNTILNAFPEIFLELDDDLKIIFANKSFREKIDSKNWKNFYFDDYLKPDYYNDFYLLWEQLKTEEKTSTFEAELKHKDGSYKYVIISLTSIHNQEKVKFYANIFDISERKEMEKDLILLQTSIEQSPIGVVITDTQANIFYVNQKYEEITGYSRDFLKGKNIKLMRSGQTPKKTYQDLWKTILNGKIWEGKFYNKKKNGDYYWEHTHISPVFDKNGKITNFVAAKEDITKELEQNEKILKLFTATETSPISVMILDENAKITYVNKAFENITGYKAEEVIGKTPSFLDSDEEDAETYEKLKNTIFEGKIWKHIIKNKKKNGEIYYSSSIVIPLTNDDGKLIGFVCNDEDITERIKITQKLQETTQQLKIKNEEILSSIRYALHIQNALMSVEENVKKIFKEYFILFLPKDIISGDFFWTATSDNLNYLAVADCTGHGVPGAFLSILGVMLLETATKEKKHIYPNEIINYVSKKFHDIFYKTKQNTLQDNMEISLIAIDKSNKKVYFSGARTKIYFYTRKSLPENDKIKLLKTIKSNLYSIASERHYLGIYYDFKQIIFEYQTGDEIILSTDGYRDQIGGKDNKKFKLNRFVNLLSSVLEEPIYKQKIILLENFLEFKSNAEQTDDVTVIGIKLY